MKSSRKRLHELHPHVRRQPADVVVRFDLRRDTVVAARLDHVRIEGALDEETGITELACLLLEDADEFLADDRPLRLRIADVGEASEEAVLRAHVHEGHVEVAAERLDDLLRLVLAHQPVVDEDARELVADRLVDEQGRDRRVDTPGETADDALRADLRSDPLDLFLDHRRRRPGGRRPGHVVEEPLQDLLSLGGVRDLRVELDGVEPAIRILEGGDGGRRRGGGDARAGRRSGDRVAVAHPHDLLRRQVAEQQRLVELGIGLAVLRDVVRFDRAAEIAGHQLHPVTDAERRDAELENRGVHLRRTVDVHRCRPTGEDQRQGVPRLDLRRREAVTDELGVDTCLAHATRDQLAVLAAEVEHEHRAILRNRLRRRNRELRHGRARAWPRHLAQSRLSHAGSSVRLS